jgi:hypothetical protein
MARADRAVPPLRGRHAAHGGFFETVPGSADAHLLDRILHEWDGAKAGLILGNLYRGDTGPGAAAGR